MQNAPSNKHDVASARWDAIARIGALATLPITALIALIIKLAWPQFQESAPFLLIFFELCLVVLTTGGIIGVFIHAHHSGKAKLERYRAETWMHLPDFNGNYPLYFNPQTKMFTQPAPGTPAPAVPQTFHYAPHVTIKQENTAGELPQLSPGDERHAVSIEELCEAIRPNTLQTGLGSKLVSGELVTAGIPESVHYKLIGGSGFGKSCLAAAMLAIATTTNSPDVLRIALLDLEHKTSRLFEELPHVYEVKSGTRVIRMIGRDADEVAARLGTLKQELNRRAASNLEKPLLLVYVEEMLSLRYEVDPALQEQMLADLNILALRGRKYGIFFLACMQIDYSSKELREAKGMFRTRGGFAIDPPAARASGFVNTELVKQNFQRGRPGQYLLEKPAFSELVLAPRYDVEQKLASTVTSNLASNPTSNAPFFVDPDATVDAATTPPQKPLDATKPQLSIRALKVLEMLRAQRGQNEIIEEIWRVKSNQGRVYREAVEEYRQIVATLVAESSEQ